MERGGHEAEQLQRIMKEGQLVPDSTMITLLKARDSSADRRHASASHRWQGGGRYLGLAVSNLPLAALAACGKLADKTRRRRMAPSMRCS